MTDTAAQFMAATLKQAGVKRVYGVVGNSLNGFTDCAAPQRRDRLDPYAPRGGRPPSPPARRPT